MPFDIEGRDLLIFDDDNNLKVKLGKFISDSLYKTKEVALSWCSHTKGNHIKNPSEIDIFEEGPVWSNSAVNRNFVISYHIRIEKINKQNINPDVRLYFSNSLNGYPRILCIFPWEFSEIDKDKYECHIDYFRDHAQETGTDHSDVRLQQVSVGEKDFDRIKNFDVFVSFCWPNLVFESTFFEDKVNRLIVPIDEFQRRGYPVHLMQYIGFESKNSRVTIDNIRIKEVFI